MHMYIHQIILISSNNCFYYDNAKSIAGTAPLNEVPHRLGVFHKRDQLGEVSHQLTFDLAVGRDESSMVVLQWLETVEHD